MTATTGQSKLGTVLRVTSGNFLETVRLLPVRLLRHADRQGVLSARAEFASLMLTFAVFGAGFLMRPLGAIILGAYIDEVGRRKGLIVTLSIMASGTILIAFVPGYATIGLLAPALVLIGRLLQGFSAGAELGGVSVYLAEMATPGRKGFFTSWQSASQQVAIVVAAALGFALKHGSTRRRHRRVGMARAVLRRLHDRAVHLSSCGALAGNREFKRAPASSEHDGSLSHDARRTGRIVIAGMLLVAMTTTDRSI